MLFGAIYVSDLIAAAVMRTEPVLREQPLAVLEGAPPLTRVCAVNAPAREAGVEVGMPKLQAAALGGLVLRMRAPAQEAAATAALQDCAHAFSPRVEPLAADTMLLDATGLERMFGAPPRLGREIAQRAAAMGLEVNVALAANREAAIHAAQGFAGVTVILAGEEAPRLGSLPVELLATNNEPQRHASHPPAKAAGRVGHPAAGSGTEEFLQTLASWGVRNFRGFAALPTAGVAQRLGQRGVALQKLARGEGSEVLLATEPPLRFVEALELEHPVELLEPLAFLLARMLEPLCARLAARALAADELTITLTLDTAVQEEQIEPLRHRAMESLKTGVQSLNDSMARSPNFSRVLRFPVPLLDARVFLKLLQLDLQQDPPPAPVLKLRLEAIPARPQVAQHGLFEPIAPAPEKLQLLLARLAGIVGVGNAGAAELEDSHRRERFVVREFAAASSELRATSKDKKCSQPTAHSSQLATRIFRPPLPATVDVRGGRPVRVVCHDARGFTGDVVWAAGPWRASGEWWKEQISSSSFLVSSSSAPALSSSPSDSRFPEVQLTARCAEARPKKHSQHESAALAPPAMEVNIGGYQYPVVSGQLPVAGETHTAAAKAVAIAAAETARLKPRPSENENGRRDAGANFVSGFAREEWDVAVCPHKKRPMTLAGRSLANEPPQPELVLYRLVWETQSKEWKVEGSYD